MLTLVKARVNEIAKASKGARSGDRLLQPAPHGVVANGRGKFPEVAVGFPEVEFREIEEGFSDTLFNARRGPQLVLLSIVHVGMGNDLFNRRVRIIREQLLQ